MRLVVGSRSLRSSLDWAMAHRVNAGLGDIAVYGPTLGSPLDPSTPPQKANMAKYGSGEWHRVLIDATRSWEFEPRPEWGGRHIRRSTRSRRHWKPESQPDGRSTGSASHTSTTSAGSC
jgi:3-polyprenyl-4-hydroxybenzoate decarboxylase